MREIVPLTEANFVSDADVRTSRSSLAEAPPVGLEPTTDRLEGCCSIL